MFLNYEYNKIVKKDLTSFNECYKMAIEKDRNAVARENMANDLAVAKENAKNRKSKK